MLDLSVSTKVATVSDVPDLLNQNGWNMGQVASVWSVGPTTSSQQSWDIASLKKLGGPKILSNVWASLRSSNNAGHHKRPADDSDYIGSSKRIRSHKAAGVLPGTNNSIVPTPSIGEWPVSCTPKQPSTPIGGSIPPTSRKLAKARRKSNSIVFPSRIRTWLSGVQQVPDQATTPVQNGETEPPPSTPTPAATTSKKKRRRRQNKKTTPKAPSNPNPIPIPDPSRRQPRRKTTGSADLKQRSISLYVSGVSPILKEPSRPIGQSASSALSLDAQLFETGNGSLAGCQGGLAVKNDQHSEQIEAEEEL